MLFLLFQLGNDRYALDASQIAEVLPLTRIKQIPQAPTEVAGVFNYRGAPVPLIDLSQLTLNRPAQKCLSTRIILTHYPDDQGEKRLLGLIAEKATETMRRETTDFAASGLDNEDAAYLGPVTNDSHGLVQWVTVDKLLPPSVRDLLFKQPVAS